MSSAKDRSPTGLVNEVFGELLSSRRGQPRAALRLLPVEAVVKADDPAGLRTTFAALWASFVRHSRVKSPAAIPTFAVDFRARNLSPSPGLISKDSAVAAWVDAVKETSPEYKVSLLHPDIILSVNVLRKCACLSILEFCHEFAKYNLQMVLPSSAPKEGDGEGDGEGGKEGDGEDGEDGKEEDGEGGKVGKGEGRKEENGEGEKEDGEGGEGRNEGGE